MALSVLKKYYSEGWEAAYNSIPQYFSLSTREQQQPRGREHLLSSLLSLKDLYDVVHVTARRN
jgi:hypothetical protein